MIAPHAVVNRTTVDPGQHPPGANERGGGGYHCLPLYTTGPVDGDFIDGVEVGEISVLASGGEGGPEYSYIGYGGTGSTTRLVPGVTYTIDITAGTYDAGAEGWVEVYAAWIDYDQNGSFDAADALGEMQTTDPFEIGSMSFTVPVDAARGYTILRVRNVFNTTGIDPCIEYGYGETEDYVVLIDGGDPCIPLMVWGTTDGDFITQVVLNDLTSTAGGAPLFAYADNDFQGATLDQGSNHSIAITSGDYATDFIAAWIDWNFDGDWDDPGEALGNQVTSAALEVVTFNFTVPADVFGYARLRVRATFNGNAMTACSDAGYGETEDYTIAIQSYTWPCLPISGRGVRFGDQIVAVDFLGNNYNNSPSDAWPFYLSWHTPPVHMDRGSSQTMTISSGTFTDERFHLFLDMNDDNTFDDPGEDLGSVNSTMASQVLPLNFTIPAACPPGQHFMRLRAYDNGSFPLGACATTLYGEVEDFVVVIEDPAGPCIPFMGAWTTEGEFIDGVCLGTICNAGTGGNYGAAYHDFTAQSTVLEAGDPYALMITSGEFLPDTYAAWIDYNSDGDWDDADENLGEVQSTTSFQTLPINFTVPAGTPLGSKRMRVRCAYDAAGMTACEDLGWGETEDYTVEVTISTSLNDAMSGAFAVLPDPAQQQVQVIADGSVGALITLMDATGRILRDQRMSSDRTMIRMQGIANGSYVILWQGSGQQRTERFVWSTE